MKTIQILIFLIFAIFSFCTITVKSQSTPDSTSKKLTSVPLQISFVPYFGTNPVKNSSVDISLNIIGGINEQVNVFEAGSVFNIVEKNSGKCQLAGMMNITGGKSDGLQAAGMLNIAKSSDGAQLAGNINISKSYVNGAQIAGSVNIAAEKVIGAQIAGCFSSSPVVDGAQISGFGNLSKELDGAQIAGFANINGSITGAQIAGFINISKTITGPQVAGFTNIAKDIKGAQIAGFINIAKNVNGNQISVFNFADTCAGVPVGVFSYVRKGYHKFEISADEFSYLGFSYRTGVAHLYNIFNVGYRPMETEKPVWSYGFGLGSLFGGNENYRYNLEVTTSHVLKGNSFEGINMLHRLYFGIDRKLSAKTSLDMGLTFNLLDLERSYKNYDADFKSMAQYTITNDKNGNRQLQSWVGARIGFRF